MTRRAYSVFWIGMIFVAFLLSDLLGCDRSGPLATLNATQGEVQRAEAAAPKSWVTATLGTTFALGDALRTAHASTATLSLDDDSTLQVRPDTTIRFLSKRPSRRHKAFDVEAGKVLLESGDEGTYLATSFGTARIEGRSRIAIEQSPQGVRFDVMVGRAQLEGSDGLHVVEAGQSYVVDVGKALVEPGTPSEVASAAPELDAAPSTSSAEAAVPPTPSSAWDPQATITARVIGSGVRERPSDAKIFHQLKSGATQLQPGTALSIGAGSSVELEQTGAAITLRAGNHVVQTSGSAIEVQNGNASVAGAARIMVPGGTIETLGQATASVETRDRGRTHLRLDHGVAMVTTKHGTTRVEAGQQVTVLADGATKLEGRGLDYADLTLDVGESLTVHDPRPPTAVRFRFGSHCPAGGLVRAPRGGYASGKNAVAFALGIGRHDYALYCLGEKGIEKTPTASGSVIITMDSGTRPVPTKPPSTSVSIDGRKYTVMYQNQLPSVHVLWPNAPQNATYTLRVASRGGQRVFTTAAPSYSFKSGALQDGRHTMHFESNGRASRYTEIDIKFDNMAPQASLLTPVESNVQQGGEIAISGTVQPGWSVEVGGRKVDPDEHQRFAQKAHMPTEERAVAVRLTHPTRGTHVYLRRAATTNN